MAKVCCQLVYDFLMFLLAQPSGIFSRTPTGQADIIGFSFIQKIDYCFSCQFRLWFNLISSLRRALSSLRIDDQLAFYEFQNNAGFSPAKIPLLVARSLSLMQSLPKSARWAASACCAISISLYLRFFSRSFIRLVCMSYSCYAYFSVVIFPPPEPFEPLDVTSVQWFRFLNLPKYEAESEFMGESSLIHF